MCIKTLIRAGVQFIFKLFPLKNRILITTYCGMQKSDSPVQIYKYMKKEYPKADIIFLWNKRKTRPIYCKLFIIKYRFYRATSKVIVDNMFAGNIASVDKNHSRKGAKIRGFLNGKPGQKYVSTWHGTPLKRMERDKVGSSITDCIINKPMYLILGNIYTADILNHILFDKAEVKLFGSPRNDILVNRNNKNIIRIKKKLELPLDKKIVLYAPTFRSNSEQSENYIEPSGIEQINLIDFSRLFHVLTEKFGGEWILICRFHYLVADMVDWNQLEEKYPNRFINGNQHEEIADYLLCSDVLITDYSSCMFDYAILNRPVFLLCHDLEHYGNEERGFYIDIDKLPFPLAEDFNGLYDNIKNFDNQIYCKKLEEMKKQMGYCEEGNATERAGDFIYRLLEDD